MDRRTEVVLGLVAILSYVVHAWHHVSRGQGENVLWICHLAALAIGIAFLARSPLLNAIGFLWLTVGVPCWLLYLATGGELLVGAVLTHGLGFVLGLVGIRRYGLPAGAWWKAIAALLAVYGLTRAVTSPAENVNLAFAVWPGWESRFPSHVVYIAVLTTASAAVFAAEAWALRLSGIAGPAGER